MSDRVILLVEDNADDQELALRALGQNNIINEVIVANDGAEALHYLWGTGPYEGRDIDDLPQVVLLDLKLPRVDGHEVLRRIRANSKTGLLPVVVLTSSQQEADVLNAYQGGANSYVRKPVDFAEFLEATRLLGRYWLDLNEPPTP